MQIELYEIIKAEIAGDASIRVSVSENKIKIEHESRIFYFTHEEFSRLIEIVNAFNSAKQATEGYKK